MNDSPAFLQQLRTEYESGCTIACLAVRYRKSVRWIHRRLRLAGTTMRAPGLPRLVEKIISLKQAGASNGQISSTLDCNRGHVSRVLVAAGLRTRKNSGA